VRQVTTENQAYLCAWVSEKLGGETPPETRCIGQEIDGELRSVVCYNNFVGRSCNISIASEGEGFFNKDYLWAIFDYPFNKLNLKVILATVAGNNEKSRNICRKLGFKEIAYIADAHNEGDLVIYTMREHDCKWLQLNAPLKKLMGA
jgi:RimJ/RimL family protein N-acetyltransferase